jgi:hypothetical protein
MGHSHTVYSRRKAGPPVGGRAGAGTVAGCGGHGGQVVSNDGARKDSKGLAAKVQPYRDLGKARVGDPTGRKDRVVSATRIMAGNVERQIRRRCYFLLQKAWLCC